MRVGPGGPDRSRAASHWRRVNSIPSAFRPGGMHLSLAGTEMRAVLEEIRILHPAVPDHLEGLAILHLSDFHLRKPWRRSRVLVEMLRVIAGRQTDLVCLTGDLVEKRGFEEEAVDLLTQIVGSVGPRLGFAGIHGNHDPPELVERVGAISEIRWLLNESVGLEGLEIVGISEPEDPLAAVLNGLERADGGGERRFRLGLAHYPTNIVPAAALGIDLLLAGHTHGGQIRVCARYAPHTSCDLTPTTASGLLRFGPSLCCISRGLGETVVPWRFWCPPQVGLYRLGRGDLGGTGAGIERLIAW